MKEEFVRVVDMVMLLLLFPFDTIVGVLDELADPGRGRRGGCAGGCSSTSSMERRGVGWPV
jgi:hypothetical protein